MVVLGHFSKMSAADHPPDAIHVDEVDHFNGRCSVWPHFGFVYYTVVSYVVTGLWGTACFLRKRNWGTITF